MIQSHVVFIEKEEVEFIGDLIMGGGPSKAKQGKCAFLFDIVSNSRNSVDVDKFDYLQRDAYNVGIKSTYVIFLCGIGHSTCILTHFRYDSGRLLQYSRVFGDEICFHAKESFNLYELFPTRYSLFKQACSHRLLVIVACPLNRITRSTHTAWAKPSSTCSATL